MVIVYQCLHQLSVCAARKSLLQLISVKCLHGSDVRVTCITEHEGFDAVCLNVWVLQTSIFSYRYHSGTRDVRDTPTHEEVIIVSLRPM